MIEKHQNLTAKQFRERLSNPPISPATMYRRIKAGLLPPPTMYIGNHPIWSLDVIELWEADQVAKQAASVNQWKPTYVMRDPSGKIVPIPQQQAA